MSWQLIQANVEALGQARRLLSSLDDGAYRQVPGCSTASVGGHLRHVIEFYQCLLRGLEVGRVDYDDRPRCPELESDRRVALIEIESLEKSLGELSENLALRALDVRQDSAVGGCSSRSSVGRELQFLLTHTVHHFALIATGVRALGATLEADFGVAASTLEHRRLTGIDG